MANSEARTERIELRMTPTEAAQLAKLSTGLGVTKAQAIRQAVAALLGEPMAGQPQTTGPGGPGEKAVFFQLDRIRSNLKQLEPIGLIPAKVDGEDVDPVSLYEWTVPRWVLRANLTDVEREKAAGELRDRIGRPLMALVLRHNRGEEVTPKEVRDVYGWALATLRKEWQAAQKAATAA